MKIKKLLALTMTTVMVGSILAGCGKTVKEEKVEKVQNVEFWTMQLSPTFDSYLKGAITKFETENKNIKVKWVDVPWGDMEKKVMAAAASTSMPDVVNLNPQFAQKLAQSNALVDMEKSASDVKENYFKGAFAASTFNGKTFGLPWYLTTGITYFNKNLFKQAGLSTDKAPATYDEMYEAAKAIKAKTGKYGFMISFKENVGMEAFEQMGSRLFNDDYTKVNFTSKDVVDKVKFFKKMMDEGLIPKQCLTEGQATIIQMYSGGEVGMFQGGTSHASMIEKNNKQVYDNTGVGEQLVNTNGKINEAVMNICVAESSKNKDAAVKFAKFITNASNQVEFAKVSGAIVPSTKDSIKDEFFNIATGNAKEQARTISAKQIANAKVIFPSIKNYGDIQTAFLSAVQKAISGQAAPEAALKEAEDTANKALAK